MGSLFGGGGGTSTTTSGLGQGFGWVPPAMSSLFGTLTSILSGGQSPYPYTMPNQQVAGFTNGQMSNLNALGGSGATGAANINSAAQGAQQIGEGKYLDPNNPALQGALSAENQQTSANYMNAIAPSTSSEFIGAGAGAGSAYNNARNANQYSLATALSNNANNVIGQNYFQNLQEMPGASAAVNAATGAGQGAYQTALGAGNQKQQQQQNVLNTNYQNQYNQATWPYQAVSMIQNLLQGSTGFGGISKAISGGGGLS